MAGFYTPLLLPEPLLKAQQAFGFALLQHVAQAAPQANVFISPFSIGVALMLALEGSAGAAREAIISTLRVNDLPPAKLATAVMRQLAVLTQPHDDQPTLLIANGLWANKEFALAPDFVARIQQQYQANAVTLDFTDPSAADVINAWASQHTAGKITRLAEPATLAGEAALVLANAVYFKGSWASEFDEADTRPGPFLLAGGGQKTVPLMRQRSQSIGYQRGPGWQAVRLHYQGYPRRATMQVFIPDQPAGLPALLASLTAENWGHWQAGFQQNTELIEVDLTLPRFRLEYEQDLTSALRLLGLGPALTPGADFTAMGFAPDAPGFIGQVAHKTYLSVDEKGTEAAGVTMMWLAGGSANPPEPRRVEVRVDRPFFCAIVDDETGTILFSGAVYEPA